MSGKNGKSLRDKYAKDRGLLTEAQVEELAKKHGCPISDICVICGIQIVVQIFRNSGVCCEQHRKDRDNDHAPFRGGALAP